MTPAHDGARIQALREGYVIPLTGPAPPADVDAHLDKAQENLDSATDDIEARRWDKAGDSGYDAGHHAIEALMADRGVRINKNDERLGQHGHAAASEYLRTELLHDPDTSTDAAKGIADKHDMSRQIRNKAAYGPRRLDEKTARMMFNTGRSVLRHVRRLLGR